MLSGGINYGENISIKGGVFDGCTTAVINGNSAGDIRLNMVSVDYCRRMFTVTSGQVVFANGFIESNFDVDNWFYVDGYGANLRIESSKITITGDILNKEMGFVGETMGYGEGIELENIMIASGTYYKKDTLVSGILGRVRARNVYHYKDATKIPIHRSLNLLRYSGFNDANSLSATVGVGDWTKFSFAEMPTLDATTFYEGTQSAKFTTATNGNSVGMYKEMPVRANEYVTVSFYRKIQGFTAATKSFTATVKYMDEHGNTLWSGGILTDTTDKDWTKQVANIQTLPPRGTTKVRLEFYANAITNTCIAWVDDVIINIV
jgi:hypothetical protein